MKCPHCGSLEDKVMESRTLAEGTAVRRRRECIGCGYRFTSYERIEEKPLMVIKSTGRREPFDRGKLARGIQRALEKRSVSQDEIEEMLNQIEDEAIFSGRAENEIPSSILGELVLKKLYSADKVAYIRFASVYRNFNNVTEFIQAIQQLEKSRS